MEKFYKSFGLKRSWEDLLAIGNIQKSFSSEEFLSFSFLASDLVHRKYSEELLVKEGLERSFSL